jgi:hypothetical protein
MRLGLVSLFVTTVVAIACRPAGPSPQSGADANRIPTAADTTKAAAVFRDSAMHEQYCEPVPPGTDWRKVCTPKDQRVIRVKPKPDTPR